MDKIRKTFVGPDETNEEEGIMTEFSNATTFSWSTRLKGFVICLVCGVVCSFLGTFFLAIPGNVGIRLFVVFYSVGNIMAISSTCFLMGPLNQLKKMFAETRIFATIIFLLFLVLTLLSGLVWKKTILAVMFCLFQFLAMVWYSLTYIPFARLSIWFITFMIFIFIPNSRDAVKRCFSSCIDA